MPLTSDAAAMISAVVERSHRSVRDMLPINVLADALDESGEPGAAASAALSARTDPGIASISAASSSSAAARGSSGTAGSHWTTPARPSEKRSRMASGYFVPIR